MTTPTPAEVDGILARSTPSRDGQQQSETIHTLVAALREARAALDSSRAAREADEDQFRETAAERDALRAELATWQSASFECEARLAAAQGAQRIAAAERDALRARMASVETILTKVEQGTHAQLVSMVHTWRIRTALADPATEASAP